MNRLSIAVIMALMASAQAFVCSPHSMHRGQPLQLMSAEENEAILKKAEDCYSGECSLDDVDELVGVLQDQQKELKSRMDQVKAMIKSLDTVNSQDDREVDQVRETVRAIFRVFQFGDKASGNDYPSGGATGFSGEIGDGPKTAYDVLAPKPYKKSP